MDSNTNMKVEWEKVQLRDAAYAEELQRLKSQMAVELRVNEGLRKDLRRVRDELDRAGKVISENGGRIFALENESIRLREQLLSSPRPELEAFRGALLKATEEPAPKWYTVDEMRHWLKINGYSESIIKELSEEYAKHFQAAFDKGFSMGQRVKTSEKGMEHFNSPAPEPAGFQEAEAERQAREAREAHQKRPPVKPLVKQRCLKCGEEIGWDEKLDALYALVNELAETFLSTLPPAPVGELKQRITAAGAAFGKPL